VVWVRSTSLTKYVTREVPPIHNQSYVEAHEIPMDDLARSCFDSIFAQLVICVHDELVELLLATTTSFHASESRIANLCS